MYIVVDSGYGVRIEEGKVSEIDMRDCVAHVNFGDSLKFDSVFKKESDHMASGTISRTIRAVFVVVLLLGAFIPAGSIYSAPPPPEPVATLTEQTGGQLRVAYHAATGQVRFIGTDLAHPIPRAAHLDATASPETAARDFLATYGSLFGLRDQVQELRLMRSRDADRGRAFVRFQQVYQGIPVFGGELIVQVDAARNILSANGEILPQIAAPTQPVIDAAAAKQTALDEAGGWHNVEPEGLQASEPALWIYNPALIRPGTDPTRLVWRLEVTARDLQPIRELVLVDTQRGNVVLHFNQIHTAKNRLTYDANNLFALPGTLRCDEANPTCVGGDSHEVAAHTHAGQTYDFYSSNHGRDSINNAGLSLISSVHYGSSYANAFWDGDQMVYGDAFGFPLADDVVAHELTHGVTQYESNLFYYYQSGAINESLSDVWGEFVDLTNGTGDDSAGVRWKMGEDITGLGAIRDMEDPPFFGDPDKITSPNYFSAGGDIGDPGFDNGGVHTNSGVNNKATFLMTDGGTFNGKTVTALGIPKVADIYYEAATDLLTSGSDYADLYNALYQACTNLIGTGGIVASDCQEVRDATDAVEMNLQPVAGFNPDAALCSGALQPLNLFFDSLEGGSGNWTFASIVGSSRWSLDSNFAHTGTMDLLGNDFPVGTSDSYAAMDISVGLPANAFLHFAHAHGFEDPNYDGGVLEYSTNGGASWTNATTLFDTNGYNGTIASGFGNPLGGIPGFVSDSHGYISSRLNLASLAGQSVRFRWRMGTDNIFVDMGWFVDDVRIYTCVTTVHQVFLPVVLK